MTRTANSTPLPPPGDVLTSDGGIVTIRPAGADDLRELAALGAGVSRLRPDPQATGGPDATLTIVVLDGTDLVGAASCVRTDAEGHTAEMAVAVAGPHRHRGIGALLLDDLTRRARDRGITRLVAAVRGPRQLPDAPGRDPGAAAGQADFTPQSALRRVLAPRTVAVVGAGRRHNGAGHEALRALRDYGFRGRLYAVNRSGRPVCGIPAYRAVADLPPPVDLLVIAVPTDQVARVLAEAGPLGVRGAVLLDTGPRGTDPVAERGRQEILRVARENGIRLLGPACLGILNTDPAVRLNATLAPARPPSGGLALAVRSGAVGIALLADAVREHCGVSTLVSLGDETDITGSDLLAHWFDDPAIRAIALSPEAFADPGRFAQAARALGRRKPVLAITSAQTYAPGEDLLAGTGVIRTRSLGETIDTARMLVDQPLPAGNRLGLVGNAGGLTALAADTARGYGFDVVPLGGSTRTGAGRGDSPVDLGCNALPARIADAAETVASSGEADLLLLILVGTRATVLAAALSALGPVLDDYPSLPVAAVVTGGDGEFHQLGRRGAPVFREPVQAVRALAHARDYAAWRREPLARRSEPTGPHAGTERATIRRAPSARPGRMDRKLTADVLAAYGIKTLPAVPAGLRPSRSGQPPWAPPGTSSPTT